MNQSTSDSFGDQRRIIETRRTEFSPYDMEGPIQDDMSYINLSHDSTTGQGAYMIRMEPGAETIRHVHRRREEFLILEGELIESDGRRLGPGDYTIYQPGTEHNSRTETGCLLIGIDYSRDKS